MADSRNNARELSPARPAGRLGLTGRLGFTLIELLVVVSIIALLIALLLPSLSRSKQMAYTTVCGTRMKALGLGLQEYLSEFDNTFPINGIIMPKSGMPQAHFGVPVFMGAEAPVAGSPLSQDAVNGTGLWRIEFGVLFHYMGGQLYSAADPTTITVISGGAPLPPTPIAIAKAYLCPEDIQLDRTYAAPAGSANYGTKPLVLRGNPPFVYELDPTQVPGAPGYWSYSVNSVLNSLGRFRDYFTNPPASDKAGNPWTSPAIALPWPDPIKMGSIRNPGRFIAMIEEGNDSLFNDEVFDAPAFNGGDVLTDRHLKGGNVSFLDGHVEYFNQVQFDYTPPGSAGFATALQSEITQMFFPDGGAFANGP